MLISVIIVNWNRVDDMKETLTSLEDQTNKNFEIVVVDNGSSDGSIEMIESNFQHVKLVRLDSNLGCEEGFNIGMQNSDGEIYFYLDSDASLDKNVLEKVKKEFIKDKELGILDPRIINPNNNLIINEPKHWPKKNAFTGCAAAIRSSVIDKIGMRPSEYFIYSSEADLCLRTINAGYSIVHFEEIIAFHRESPEKRLSDKFYYYFTRNGLWLIWKYYPLTAAISETFIHLIFNFYRSTVSLSPWYFFWGLAEGLIYFKKYALDKRSPIEKYHEAKLYPPFSVFLSIISFKIKNIAVKNEV